MSQLQRMQPQITVGTALQTNLFDSGLKWAALFKPLVTEPVDSVSLGEAHASAASWILPSQT